MGKYTFFIAAGLLVSACATPASDPAVADRSPLEAATSYQSAMTSVASDAGFDETLTRLRAAITSRGLTEFAVIDHAAGAASVDQVLSPATLVIFGSPKAGTPLMQADIRIGLELPLKMLVYQVGERVYVGYRDMSDTAVSFGIAAQTAPLPGVVKTQAAMAAEAAGGATPG
mgnify:CR=1 FL=1